MAQTKGNIEEGNAAEGEAVESTTTEVPHEADASSEPGPYEGLEIDRPPVRGVLVIERPIRPEQRAALTEDMMRAVEHDVWPIFLSAALGRVYWISLA